MSQRRGFLVWVGLAASIYGLRALPWDLFFANLPTFRELPGLPPFRSPNIDAPISTTAPALVGIEGPAPNAEARRGRAEAVKSDMCRALFGTVRDWQTIPMAYFSEFRCPYCRALEAELAKVLAANSGTVRLVQHELPIFGPPSEYAARASIAAARQGLQQELRKRLMRSPLVPDPALISRLAIEVGLDPARLVADMDDPSVQRELDRTRALADVFGFAGTPGLVIGRTVLNGFVKADVIERIIADERAQSPMLC